MPLLFLSLRTMLMFIILRFRVNICYSKIVLFIIVYAPPNDNRIYLIRKLYDNFVV